jgi:hypothetical protein
VSRLLYFLNTTYFTFPELPTFLYICVSVALLQTRLSWKIVTTSSCSMLSEFPCISLSLCLSQTTLPPVDIVVLSATYRVSRTATSMILNFHICHLIDGFKKLFGYLFKNYSLIHDTWTDLYLNWSLPELISTWTDIYLNW